MRVKLHITSIYYHISELKDSEFLSHRGEWFEPIIYV